MADAPGPGGPAAAAIAGPRLADTSSMNMTIGQPAAAATEETLPLVLDVEASGFGRGSYPIEIGYVLPDGSGFCTLIRPMPDWTHWDERAEALHGIARLTAQCHGRAAAAVARLLNERLRGRTVYCDGWAQDYAWVHALFAANDMAPDFRIEHLMSLLTPEQARRWDAVRDEVRQELNVTRHRASTDARVLQLSVGRLRAAPH